MDQATMLNQLGNTAQDVALSLRNRQIRGVRNTARFLNPVVRYVQGQVPGARSIDAMTGESVRIVLADGTKRELPLPQAVKDFLDAFNRGEFPDLEAPPDRLA
jgi:hypothetical protein